MTVELAQDARATLGEGPVWDERAGRLYWVDITAGLIHRYSPSDGSDFPIDVGQPVGCIGLGADGGIVAALRDGFGLMRAGEKAVTLCVPVERGQPINRMNDGGCDPAGRFWAGTTGSPWEQHPEAGALYCLEQVKGKFRARRIFGRVSVSNGLDWSGDGKRMYYIDSARRKVDVFDFDVESGSARNRRTFVEIMQREGLPDGLVVDADDCLWVALCRAGRIRRYTPAGIMDREIRVPASLVTSMTFGGRDLDVLYITTARHRLTPAEAQTQVHAGGLFCCQPGPTGRPANRFRWI
jgi:sugar lactone lactonase YvrE